MPRNHFLVEQIGRANEQRQLAGLAEGARNVAQEQLTQRICTGRRTNRSRGSHSVNARQITESRGGKRVHQARPGQRQNCTRSKRRIDEVLADTAKDHLAQQDGDHRTDHRHPIRHSARQIHRQQHTGHDSAEIADRIAGMGGLAIQPLAQNRSRDRQCEDERRTIAEKQHTGDGSGQQRNADIPHDARGRDIIAQMRRRRNHILGHFHVPPYSIRTFWLSFWQSP